MPDAAGEMGDEWLLPQDPEALAMALLTRFSTVEAARFLEIFQQKVGSLLVAPLGKHSAESRKSEVAGKVSPQTPLPTTSLAPSLEEIRKAWPKELLEILRFLDKIRAPEEFYSARYWSLVDEWLGHPNSGVAYLDELPKYLIWQHEQPPSKTHKKVRIGFRRWLAKSEFWAQQQRMREATRAAQTTRPRH